MTLNQSEFLPDGSEDLFILRESEPALLGNDLVIYPHSKLASVALLQLRFDSEFGFNHLRHTGGSRTE